MNLLDWLIIALLGAAAFAALRGALKKKGGCCGDCTKCGGCVEQRK